GLEVDLAWEGGKAISATLRASRDGEVRLAVPAGQKVAGIRAGRQRVGLVSADGTVSAGLKRGGTYDVMFD
ncbi:MAG: hypothetical protein M3O31_11275, partial [Acidobacteriota bacterium]|nr:hypothetical protein [Acidobacteriota bacterium]